MFSCIYSPFQFVQRTAQQSLSSPNLWSPASYIFLGGNPNHSTSAKIEFKESEFHNQITTMSCRSSLRLYTYQLCSSRISPPVPSVLPPLKKSLAMEHLVPPAPSVALTEDHSRHGFLTVVEPGSIRSSLQQIRGLARTCSLVLRQPPAHCDLTQWRGAGALWGLL